MYMFASMAVCVSGRLATNSAEMGGGVVGTIAESLAADSRGVKAASGQAGTVARMYS